jgi:glycosyltransferase involved in cell wall biosynthesis
LSRTTAKNIDIPDPQASRRLMARIARRRSVTNAEAAAARSEAGSRPRLLSVNFFPAFFPPRDGKEQRYVNLYAALSEHYEIDLVTATDFAARYEETWHTPSLRELRFPQGEHWRRAFETLANAGVTGDLSGLGFALAVSDPTCPLRLAALRLAESAAVVVHEYPYSEPIFREAHPRFEVYNANHFELGRLSSAVSGVGVGRCFQKLLHLECDLAARAKLLFATSEPDGEQFRLLYGVAPERIRYCPNGYSEAELAPIETARRRRSRSIGGRPVLLFIGSQHAPNVDAAEFLLDLAAELDHCDITIAGDVSQHFRGRGVPENVSLVAPVDSSEKQRLLCAADLFLNPVIRASATSIEAVEMLAGFLPMIATPEAARGVGLEPDKHAIVCQRSAFAAAIRALLANAERRERMAEEGLALARRKFTWPAIAQRLAHDLKPADEAASRARRRGSPPRRPLLVVLDNHAIGAPPPGSGAPMKTVSNAPAADVIRLAVGAGYGTALLEPGLLQVTLGKSPYHRAFEDRMGAGHAVSIGDFAAGLFLGCDHVFADLLSRLAARCTAVMFGHCSMAPALDWLSQARPELPIVFQAHNPEGKQKAALLRGHPWRDPLVRFRADLEQRLTAAADLVVNRRRNDAAQFRGIAAEALTAPLRDWLGRLGDRLGTGDRKRGRSLLVVTYRYTEPPLGGAEEYLIEVLRWLRPRFQTVELAAVDVVGPLTNRHHFGCGFVAGKGAARVLGELFDCVRLFAPDVVPDAVALAVGRQLERSRMRSELHLYALFAGALRKPDAVLLLGGFYLPEDRGGRTCRWTAPEFAFLIPAGAHAISVDGWTPRRKLLVVSATDPSGGKRAATVELHRQYIDLHFSCKIALEGGFAPAVIRCAVDEHNDPCDYRPLGVLLEQAWALVRSGDSGSVRQNPHSYGLPLREIRAELEAEIEPILRTEHFEAWVDRLQAVAQARPEADETAFAAVRGPHSAALQAWLADAGACYDLVLVQGIPFDTVPSTVETLDRLEPRPRIVILPHFHGEDPFYYWRRFLESFAAADKTLFFSQAVAERLADPAKCAVVPGGGIKIEEVASDELVSRFYAVHPSAAPFFLVLGRKVGSKGYERVIRALGELRDAGRAIDLVMIGPDDDGVPIGGPGVHYLGFQPRPIVLGALSACLGLVTMSDSESFGIVVCEAWKFRKPVIANRACAAFRELVADRETGLLAGSDAQLAAAMAEIADDAPLRARLGEAGFARALSDFTWQRVADLVGDVLLDGLD